MRVLQNEQNYKWPRRDRELEKIHGLRSNATKDTVLQIQDFSQLAKLESKEFDFSGEIFEDSSA